MFSHQLLLRGLMLVLLLLLVDMSVRASPQHPLFSRNVSGAGFRPAAAPASRYNKESVNFRQNFTPIGNLSSVSVSEYTLLAHPLFPNYGVRIKKTDFCDPSVNSYTGYIDKDDRHLFFYFFESRNDPNADDVIFWTNGGPGSSSAYGLFMELGPCRISDDTGPKYFSYSWTNKANIFFVDQPVGVGWSYADNDETVSTTEAAAADIAAFVAIFFEHFVNFVGRRFHMAGESYGGRYVPLFTSAVYDQNVNLVQAGRPPINLVSAIIGNGMTEVRTLQLSYYDIMCTHASIAPFVDIASCVRMKQVLPRCSKWLKESCTDTFDAIKCEAAFQFCNYELLNPMYNSGRNIYDVSKNCDGGSSGCTPGAEFVQNYLNSSATRALLNIPPVLSSRPFILSSPDVLNSFWSVDDDLHSSNLHVAALLEHGVKVLIYAGTYDFICNWVGNERWTRELNWSGGEDFSQEPLRVWNVSVPNEHGNGTEVRRAGRVRSNGALSFATVEGAGHLVPRDKPLEAWTMIDQWLAGNDL